MKGKKTRKIVTFWTIVAAIVILIGSTFTLIQSHLNLGLDLVGGFEILYEVAPLDQSASGNVDMNAVVNSIQKRVNVLGVSEPTITVEGNNRVRVQLAGVADPETARQMIGTTANLTFRDADDRELADSGILQEGGASLGYKDGRPIVSLKIKDASKFAEITAQISKKSAPDNVMVIWLDYKEGQSYKAEAAKAAKGENPAYVSAASVRSTISGDCIIEGNFTEKEATTLASLINSGSLPVKMTEISSDVVSSQYGADALHRTLLAGFVAILAVVVFMISWYRAAGFISAVMLAVFLWCVFGVYAAIGAVFTLTGIAALVLGVGMTIDANIIMFERIRQELYKGHSVENAVAEGQKLSYSAIFDGQLTTLIAGLIMYIWGNGTVKGFATMLMITTFMTLLINVGFTKFLLSLISDSGVFHNRPEMFGVKKTQIPDVSKGQEQFYFGMKRGMDYIGNSGKFILTACGILALAVVLGIFGMARHDGFLNLGIDFASGTKLTVTSDQPLTVDAVQSELDTLGYRNFTYQAAGENTVYATTKQSLSKEDLTTIKQVFSERYGQEPGDNIVTPTVGHELVRNALILTLVAWVFMLAYVAFRYEWDYSLGALVALIHDVMITLCAFVLFRFEVNISVISVLLTIIGYSINNTIVVFDRLREAIQSRSSTIKKSDLKGIANGVIDDTLKMSIYSSITTILPVLFMMTMGSRSIFVFTFAMFVGLIAGTFSSIFVAPYVWYQVRMHVAEKPKKPKKKKKEILDEYTVKGINA
ncbi:MAG: protein translocase subunit SecD [Bulleidia sp.]